MDPPDQPLERAVALRYDPGEGEAPVLLAKGGGELARKIIALAEEAGVPITKDPDLVQLLMALDVGQSIPPQLYQAVAVVLGYVYSTNRKLLEQKGLL